MEKIEFSVLMSVYYKEQPQFLKESLESIFEQTLLPTEVVLIKDGELTNELETVIDKFERKYSILRTVKLKENVGLGNALRIGIEECKYKYICRADTDDICLKNRFEKQINYMIEHNEIDVLGTDIYEFQNNINEKMRIKRMPTGMQINNYILKRNPINHMTACYKKEAIVKAGNYEHMQYLEDYYLWIRMHKMGMKLDNINEPLVYARIGNGFEKRRGNKKQLDGWKKIQKYMYTNRLINIGRYIKNMLNMYLIIYCPNFVRKIVYKFILRK